MKISTIHAENGNRTFFISLLFFLLISVFQLSNIIPMINEMQRGVQFPSFLRQSFIIYSIFHIAFGILLFLPDRKIIRISLPILLVAFSSSVTLLITPKEIGGDLVLIFAAVLMQKYGFLKRKTLLKLFFFAIVLISTRAGTVIMGNNDLFRAINQTAIFLAAFPLVYWLYEPDLIRIRKKTEKLVSETRQNTVFAEFGKNVAGIIHDLRNYANVFESFGEIFKDADEKEKAEALREFDIYIKQLNQRIDGIMFVTKKRNDSVIEEVEIGNIIDAITYIFKVNAAFKQKIRITEELPSKPVHLKVHVQPLTRLLENVIRNSCEAIISNTAEDVNSVKGRVNTAVTKADGRIIITVTDNGPGFPFEFDGNILNAPQLDDSFTTKEGGGGLGLYNIRLAAEVLGASVDIRSVKGRGVTTTVSLPDPS